MPLADERRALRIVAVFGGGGSDASVAEVLASLVSERGADITGVFLEDHSLFRLAELPFATEICRITTARRPLTAVALKRQMKIQALHAERAVRSVAERAGSTWSFRTHRGRLSTALAETRDAGLVLLGTARRALASVGELRVTARIALAGGVESLRPVAVLFDQPEAGARALNAGIELAERTGRSLIVFLSGEARDAHSALIQKLQPLGPKRAAIRAIPSTELGAILTAVRRAAPVVLIVGAGEADFEEPRISALRGDLSCPVAVVR